MNKEKYVDYDNVELWIESWKRQVFAREKMAWWYKNNRVEKFLWGVKGLMIACEKVVLDGSLKEKELEKQTEDIKSIMTAQQVPKESQMKRQKLHDLLTKEILVQERKLKWLNYLWKKIGCGDGDVKNSDIKKLKAQFKIDHPLPGYQRGRHDVDPS